MAQREQEARQKIDELLADAGWAVRDLSDVNPSAHCGVDIRVPQAQTRNTAMVDPLGSLVGVIPCRFVANQDTFRVEPSLTRPQEIPPLRQEPVPAQYNIGDIAFN